MEVKLGMKSPTLFAQFGIHTVWFCFVLLLHSSSSSSYGCSGCRCCSFWHIIFYARPKTTSDNISNSHHSFVQKHVELSMILLKDLSICSLAGWLVRSFIVYWRYHFIPFHFKFTPRWFCFPLIKLCKHGIICYFISVLICAFSCWWWWIHFSL